jgi:hypothetical protein
LHLREFSLPLGLAFALGAPVWLLPDFLPKNTFIVLTISAFFATILVAISVWTSAALKAVVKRRA